MSNMKMRYIDFLEDQRVRDERNHRIIEALNKVDNSLANMTAKTNRLAILRKQYEMHLLRSYSTRKNGDKGSRDGSKASRRNASNIQTNDPNQTLNSFVAQPTSNFTPTNQRYVKQESEAHSKSRTPHYRHQSRPVPRDSQRAEQSVSDPRSSMGLRPFGARNPELSASTFLGNVYTGLNSVQPYDISATDYPRPSVVGLDSRWIRPTWLDSMSEQSSNSCGNYSEAFTRADYAGKPLERIATNDKLVGYEGYDEASPKLFPRLEEADDVTPDDFTAIELDRCINRIRGLFSKKLHNKDTTSMLAPDSSAFLTDELMTRHSDPATRKLAENDSYTKSTGPSSEDATGLANSKLDHQNSKVSSIPSNSVYAKEIYHDIAGDEVHLVAEDPDLDDDVDTAPAIIRYNENNAKGIVRSGELSEQKTSAGLNDLEDEKTEVKAVGSPVKNSDNSISILKHLSSEKSVDSSLMKSSDTNLVRREPEKNLSREIRNDHRDGDSKREKLFNTVDSRGSGDRVSGSSRDERSEGVQQHLGDAESTMRLEQNVTKVGEELAGKTNEYPLQKKSDLEPNKQYETSEDRQMYGKKMDEPFVKGGIHDYQNDQRYEIDPTRSRDLDSNGPRGLNSHGKYAEHSSNEHQTRHDGLSNENGAEQVDGTLKELAEGKPYADYVTDPNQQYEAHPNELYEADPNKQYKAHPNEQYEGNPNEQYEVHPNEQYEVHPNQQYEVDSNQQYKAHPNELYEADPNQQYSANLHEQYEGDPNEQYEADPNQQYKADPNEQYKAHPNQQYDSDPNQQYKAHPNEQYEAHPNEQYEAHPNQQYKADPNEQYEAHPNELYEADPNQQYTADPNEQYDADPNQQYKADPNEQYEAHPNELYEADPNKQYKAHPNEQYQVNPNEQYEENPNQEYEANPNEQYETYPNEQYVAKPEEVHGSNSNEDYAVDPAKQYEFGLNQPYDETANNEYEGYSNEQQYYGAHDPQASSRNVVDGEYEYYSNEQYVQDPNNQQYGENPNASYIQQPHDYQPEEYGQNESYDRRAYEYYDENSAHPGEFNSNNPEYDQQSGFDHGQDYGTVDHGVFGDNGRGEQVEDRSISESIPNNAMGGTDKKTKDAINALLDSGTESTIERDQSNTTENDFDFN